MARQYIVDTIVNGSEMPTYINKETIQHALFSRVIQSLRLRCELRNGGHFDGGEISDHREGYLLDLSNCCLGNKQLTLILQYMNKNFYEILIDTVVADLSGNNANIAEKNWQPWHDIVQHVACLKVHQNHAIKKDLPVIRLCSNKPSYRRWLIHDILSSYYYMNRSFLLTDTAIVSVLEFKIEAPNNHKHLTELLEGKKQCNQALMTG